jgi:hypothetical protein
MDLRGCKHEQIEEAIKYVNRLFEPDAQDRITASQMDLIRRQFSKMGIELPIELEQKIEDAEEFSKAIKKKLSS